MSKIKQKQSVILVHGLIRSRASMLLSSIFLKRNGFLVANYAYSSTKYTIDEHSDHFALFIAKFAKKHPNTKINFLTHSLGGIITRGALALLDNKTLKSLNRIVMLAPPNRGSMAATFFSKSKVLTSWMKPLCELRNAPDSKINSIHIPKNIEIGVIAGKYDKKVTPEESHLCGEKDHLTVNAMHTFIMNRPDVLNAVLSFFKTGSFLFDD